MSIFFRVRKKGSKDFIDLFAVNRRQAIINMERIRQSKKFMVRDPIIEQRSLEKARRIAKGNR